MEPAGQAKLHDVVAKMPSKLSQDGRCGVGNERLAALGVEAVERLDESQVRYLDQVLDRLPGAAIAQGQGARQGQEADDQLLPDPLVVSRRVLPEQPLLIARDIVAAGSPSSTAVAVP